MNRTIWWIRRDLRLTDNQALQAALKHAEVVIPVFILDPKLLDSPYVSQQRLAFLFKGLQMLDRDLRKRGSMLIVRKGRPLEVLRHLMSETDAMGIFAEADISPYARQRDKIIMRELPVKLTPGSTIHPPEALLKSDGLPYTIFTPFRRKWHSLPFPSQPIPAPQRLASPPRLANLAIPNAPQQDWEYLFPAGEVEAQRRLNTFIDYKLPRYAEDRNRLDLSGTSELSPYLRLGILSTRQAVWAVHEAEAHAEDATSRNGAATWLNELIWREFYTAILYHYPYVRSTSFRPALREIRWQEDEIGFNAWAGGQTGYPVVDAAMRQLNTIGWMHNRARMIAASFLTKDLLIDWRLGERYFMQHLLDGDPASNNGGWQWTAGTGTDAAPYFRVFNPTIQGKKFDPRGAYVRRWITELAAVPDVFIHTPWDMPIEMQNKVGCVIGRDYPAPIVDHALARQRVMNVYAKAKREGERIT